MIIANSFFNYHESAQAKLRLSSKCIYKKRNRIESAVPSRLDYRRQMSLAMGASLDGAFLEERRRASAMPGCIAHEITAFLARKMTRPRFISFCISLARSFRKRQEKRQKSKQSAATYKLPFTLAFFRASQTTGSERRRARVSEREELVS